MSSETKHSPGPWRWEGPDEDVIYDADDVEVCRFVAGNPDTFEADAALIASAPDLSAQVAALTDENQRLRAEAANASAIIGTFTPGGPTYDELVREGDRLAAEVERLKGEKDGAYSERNRCVAFIARMAWTLGWACWRGKHDPADTTWDADWRNIVFIAAPTGQLSWHIHDSELPLFAWIPSGLTEWDGHSTEEKYRRMASFNEGHSAALRSAMSEAATLRAQLEEARRESEDLQVKLSEAFDSEVHSGHAALEREKGLIARAEKAERERGRLEAALRVARTALTSCHLAVIERKFRADAPDHVYRCVVAGVRAIDAALSPAAAPACKAADPDLRTGGQRACGYAAVPGSDFCRTHSFHAPAQPAPEPVREVRQGVVVSRRPVTFEGAAPPFEPPASALVVGMCAKECDHGSPCQLTTGHPRPDRHETEHGCIFYDASPPPSSALATTEAGGGEALPCPFCGVGPEIQPGPRGGPGQPAVICENEECAAGPMVYGDTKAEAIAHWNRRTDKGGRRE